MGDTVPRIGCGVCKMPIESRQEVEALITDGQVSIRDIASRFGVGKNVIMRHSHSCMTRAPSDAQSKLKEMFPDIGTFTFLERI